MADITEIFPGGFRATNTTPSPAKTVQEQVREQMLEMGLTPPSEIIIDGKVHRFNPGTKGRGGQTSKPGWYIIFPDEPRAGRIGCFRSDVESTFCENIGRELSPMEKMQNTQRLQEAAKVRDEERKRNQQIAADTASVIWSGCTAAQETHPYLAKKGVKPHGARVTGDGRLVVPLCGIDGNIASLQYIDAEGGKKYHARGKSQASFWQVGAFDEPGTLYIAEGFATAATIYEKTNRPCIVAYSASNIVPVTEAMRKHYGDQQTIVIVADNDESGVGQKYADQASAKYGAQTVIPPIPGDANDYVQAGHDLVELLTPPKLDWLVSADDFCAQPAPLSWLLKNWIPAVGLGMMFGPSGGGKTFVILDWCLSIAAGLEERMGNNVKPGTVVYLAGEGHHGLRGRVAVWKQENKVSKLDMFLSRDGCDLNTPEGFLRVVQSIRSQNIKPSMIVVDTLHRFLKGDENSAQDTKTMLDACGALINEFQCAVMLIHHTGVSDEAQHRARGSSAWKGALDTEISIVPADKNGNPMEIIHKKIKDGELQKTIYCRLDGIAIRGWFDEDNEQVTSAVVRQVDESEKKQKSKSASPADKHKRLIERAFWHGGAEVATIDGGRWPYFSRSAFRGLLEKDGKSQTTIKNYICATYPKGPVNVLMEEGIIQPHAHGWVIAEPTMASVLLMRKGSENGED